VKSNPLRNRENTLSRTDIQHNRLHSLVIQTLQGDGDSSEDDYEDNENSSDDDELSPKSKLEINTDQDKKMQKPNNDYKGQLHNIIK
jgi:hypothetical protein